MLFINSVMLTLCILLVIIIVAWQIRVCKKYLFEYAKTKVDETAKTITVKNRVIPFSEINEVYVHDVEISLIERFLVSVILFNGVSEMKLVLNNGADETIILPKNYISLFCRQLESAGVRINW